MNKNKLWGLLLGSLVIVSLLISIKGNTVEAKPAFAVTLISFDVTALDNAVLIEWETGTEPSAAGFKIKRAKGSENAVFLADPDGNGDLFIRSEGGPSTGSNYEFTDNTAVNNNIYTYMLVEIESNGNENVVDQETVTVGVEPTATQIIVGGGTNTSQPTATPRPATATPTTTSGSAATATAVPTNTIAPTANSAQTQPTASSTPAAVSDAQNNTPATAVSDSDTKPVEIPATVAVQEITSDSNVAIAQAQEESAAYPAPIDNNNSSEIIVQGDAGQAASDPATNVIGDNGATAANTDDPVAIGSQPNAQQTANDAYPVPAAQEDGENSGGRAYLWGGFLVALLVFGIAVVGAIFLYTRKQNPGA